MRVTTSEGDIERCELEVTDEVVENDGARAMATVWRHNGKVVRRDVWVNPLRFAPIGAEQGL